MRHGRMLYGRVVHLVDDQGVSVCGRRTRYWFKTARWVNGVPSCKLCAKGDRLRMPT